MVRPKAVLTVAAEKAATPEPLSFVPSAEAIEKTARVLGPSRLKGREGAEASLGNWNGQREWAALLRQIDRDDPSWRD